MIRYKIIFCHSYVYFCICITDLCVVVACTLQNKIFSHFVKDFALTAHSHSSHLHCAIQTPPTQPSHRVAQVHTSRRCCLRVYAISVCARNGGLMSKGTHHTILHKTKSTTTTTTTRPGDDQRRANGRRIRIRRQSDARLETTSQTDYANHMLPHPPCEPPTYILYY